MRPHRVVAAALQDTAGSFGSQLAGTAISTYYGNLALRIITRNYVLLMRPFDPDTSSGTVNLLRAQYKYESIT